MPLLLIGLNHHSAPVALREQIAFSALQITAALPRLCAAAGLSEALILSTCNRTEIYTLAAHSEPVLNWLIAERNLAPSEFSPHWYFHHGLAVVKHLAQVSSGLHSMILGEPQIFGQVKNAYQLAKQAGTLGGHLQPLFQHNFFVTKKIRTDTQIGQKPVSIAFTSVTLVRRIFAEPAACKVLLVGAGETIELVAQHLSELGLKSFRFVNRGLARASALATRFAGEAFELSELTTQLAQTDIIIAATDSAELLIHAEPLMAARAHLKRTPLLLIDLAVPRNIDPLIAKLSDCYLYSLDDLQSLIQETWQSRRDAALQAEAIIDMETRHYAKKIRHMALAPQISALNQQANKIRDQQLTEALHSLAKGAAVETVLQHLAHKLTQQLLHIPMKLLRDRE